MTIITQLLQYKRLVRMRDLGLYFQSLLPPAATEFTSDLASALAALAELAGSQKTTAVRARDLARAKRIAREVLRADMLAINRVATAVALQIPAFDRKFQMPTLGDARLLAAARSFAEVAAPLSDVFIKSALPPSFLVDLDRDIHAFEEAVRQYGDGARACRAVDAEIEESMQEALTASAHLDAIVRNTLYHDLTKIADWDRACELGRTKPPKRAKDQTAENAPVHASTPPATATATTAA